MSKRKPHNHLSGYIAERKCAAQYEGHIVLFDRMRRDSKSSRWQLVHFPTGACMSYATRAEAYDVMRSFAPDSGHVLDRVLEAEIEALMEDKAELLRQEAYFSRTEP